ncbi:MAG: hypothetical protein H7Z21_12120 [Hymenobacter sp.]|nr:hypothetical protein [Hymenobacter sp.]
MSQLRPSPAPDPIDYAQRRYRWVGYRGRHWYRMVLLTLVGRRGSRPKLEALHAGYFL